MLSGRPIPAWAKCGNATGSESRLFPLSGRHSQGYLHTDRVEALHRSLRKIIKTRGAFPTKSRR